MNELYRFLNTPVEYLKGIGPQRSALLAKDLKIYTFGDLLYHFPYRYDDRTKITDVANILGFETSVQVKGQINYWEIQGEGRAKRLIAYLHDGTDSIELTWFKGIDYIAKSLKKNVTYLAYGKPHRFRNSISIAHPELEIWDENSFTGGYEPVYNTSDKMKRSGLDSKGLRKAIVALLEHQHFFIPESMSDSMRAAYNLPPKSDAIRLVHMPPSMEAAIMARNYFKFEELLFFQLLLHKRRFLLKDKAKGIRFQRLELFNKFYHHHMPFELTGAQKRVIKEMYADMSSGKQMNRLLQGDVGSGKTMVAFLLVLIAADNGHQSCLMAPTEILAQQHYESLKIHAQNINLDIGLITGSTTKKEREQILHMLQQGRLKLLIGTHALLEDVVKFESLGLCIIDEQHRFGVAQRAVLWQKNEHIAPHILVMTATPIPRTLAMTLYSDLDLSVIDELPPGRKAIKTVHYSFANRPKVYQFIRDQIQQGRQAYIVYPLIEESEKLDYQNLMEGVEQVKKAFSEFNISVVHGRMKPAEKEEEMAKFLKNQTQIMVATTVIEVGVNVPNATVMLIENAEKFGLSQLHQLRGRVGRGASQSYCILLSGNKVSREGRIRLETMVRTTDGFEIADVDLKLRGPGDVMGTQQSGLADLKLIDFAHDQKIIELTRQAALQLIADDKNFSKPENQNFIAYLNLIKKEKNIWASIS